MAAKSKESAAETGSGGSAPSAIKLPALQVGTAGMYVLEHFLVLVHVAIGLSLIAGMFHRVLDSLVGNEASGFLASFEYETTIGMLAATVIVFSLLGVFFTRVRAAEQADKSVTKSTWRSVWLNLFLAGTFIWGLSALIGLLNELIDALLNAGFDDGGEELWVSVLRYAFVLALAIATWMFFYDKKQAANEQNDRKFMVMFTGIATLLLILTAAFPLADQRNRRIDSFIEKDLASIADVVEDYVSSENELPRDLNDLNLDDDIVSRMDTYDYEYTRTSSSSFSAEYELCATFKTDTTELEDDTSIGFLDAVTGTFPAEFGRHDFSKHEAGRDCFMLTANSFNPFSGGFDGFESSPSSGDLESLFETIQ